MRTSNYSVFNRKINFVEVSNLTGNENVDTFHFDFDSEWNVFGAKYLVLVVGVTSYIDMLDENNDVVLRPVAYDRDDVKFGIYGIQGEESAPTNRLSSNVVWLETIPGIWGQIRDVADLPSKTVWELYTEEMLGLLAQGQIQINECESILTQIQLIQTALNSIADTVSGDKDAVTAMKATIEAEIAEVNVKIMAFDTNFAEKLAAFNANYDTKLGLFNTNASDKITAFNNNASSKTSDFNSNYTEKLGAVNTAGSTQVSAVNTAGTTQVSSVNTAGSTQVGNVETAGTTQVGLVNSAGTEAVSNVEDAEDEAIENIQIAGASYDARITDLELLKSNLNEVKTVKSTYHNIIDSLNAKIEDIVIYGMTEQTTTTGKNLCDIILDGTISSTVLFKTYTLEPNTKYTASTNTFLSSSATANVFIDLGSTLTPASGTNGVNNSKTIETDSTGLVTIGYRNYNDSLNYSSGNYFIQLEQGETATTYEPYTGGQASPNPSYPQDNKVVTGDVIVETYSKNMFNKSDVTQNYRLGGDGTLYADSLYATSDFIRAEKNANYKFNTFSSSECICFYSKNKVFISRIMGGSTSSCTTTSGTYYVRFAVLKTKLDTFQCEKGTTATSYEAFKGKKQLLSLASMELCKIGDYQDKLFKAVDGNTVYDSLTAEQKANLTVGRWYKYKAINKLILNGTEEWLYSSETFILQVSDYVTSGLISMSNRFIAQENVTMTTELLNEHFSFRDDESTRRLYVKYTDISDYNAFKTWLSTNNLVVYYALQEPTFELITNETLSAQLNAYELQTYKNITNIFTSTDNLEPELEVSYLKDDRVGYEERLTNLENALVSLGANV